MFDSGVDGVFAEVWKGWKAKYSHRKINFVDSTTGHSSLGKLYETVLPLFAYIPALPTTYQN